MHNRLIQYSDVYISSLDKDYVNGILQQKVLCGIYHTHNNSNMYDFQMMIH